MPRPVAPCRDSVVIRIVLAVLSAATAAAALAACGSTSATSTAAGLEKPDLTVAVVPAGGAAAVYIAQMDGYFAQAGLHVTIETAASGSDALAPLLHGAVDVDEGQWTSDLAAEATGVQLHALAAGNAGAPGVNQLVIPASSPISTVQQLAGQTIAVNELQGIAVDLTDVLLAEYGLSPARVHYVVVPFPAMGAALAARRVDAAFMVQPYAAEAQDASGAQELADLDQGATQNFPLTGYVVTRAWMRKYPRTAAAFSRALARGQRDAATSVPAAEQALERYTGISKKTAATMATSSFPLTVTASDLDRVGDLMNSEHGFGHGVTVSGLAREMTAP